MEHISLLRIAGLGLAILLMLFGGRRLRRHRGSRIPSALLTVVGLGLALVSIAPDLVRPLRDVLGLEGEPLGRLVTVLLVSVAFAYLLLFYALARADRANQRVGRLIRSLSAAQVEAQRIGRRLGGVLVCVPAFN